MIVDKLLLALDPVEFARSVGLEPDPWQAAALRSPARRALWNISRQAGKSTTAALMAAHRALYYPGSLVLLVSPSLRQSSELFRKVRGFLPGSHLPEDNRLSAALANGSRIVSLPGDEKTVRGYSAPDLIIEDEAARVPDELFYAVRPMLAVSGGRQLLLSTPFGKRGHFWDLWSEGGEGWERVLLPATDNPRISQEFLDQERASIGAWWFSQEYLCAFCESIDSVFSYDDVMGAVSAEVTPLFGGSVNYEQFLFGA